jgi:hypothetical protein
MGEKTGYAYLKRHNRRKAALPGGTDGGCP